MEQHITDQLTDNQKELLKKMKRVLDGGVLDQRYQKRSFVGHATPFMFPDAYSVNQHVFANENKVKNATSIKSQSARKVHREQFWNHLSREEILLHDHYSWQKLAQLEENMKPSNQENQPKKRQTKAYSKLFKSVIKVQKKENKGGEKVLKAAFDFALQSFKN